MAGSAKAADEAQQSENRQQALGVAKTVDLPTEPERGQAMVSIEESCSPVAASERAALGGAVKACVETRPTKASSTVTARTAEEADTVEACDITKPGKWTWERTKGICLNGKEVTFTLSDEQGAVLGTALIDIKSSINLRYDSLTWNELITVKVTNAVRARNTIMCTSPVVVSWWSVGAWLWIVGDDLCGEEWLDGRGVGGDIAGIGTFPSG